MKSFLKKFFKWLGLLLAVILLLVGILWVYLAVRSHKTYTLPKPSGAYHIGHTMYDWTDSKRTNAFAGKPQEKRELMTDVWYPTNQSSGASAPYLPPAWAKAADNQDGGGALLKHPLSRVKTNAFENATVENGTFPVIIFQPGYGRNAADYTAFAEDMASHGYVVIGSTPTYIADLVVLNNGNVIKTSSQAALPEGANGLSDAMKRASDNLVTILAGDSSFLIDQATAITSDKQSLFHNKLDLNNIGVMGHSMGGAAAYQVCKSDIRCKVAVDLDGTLYGDTTAPSRVPFMYVSSDHSKDQGDTKQEDDYNDSLLRRQSLPTYHVSIAGAAHFNFSDLALYSVKPAMRLFGVVGQIDGKKGVELTNLYVNEMFGKYLGSKSAWHLDSTHTQDGVTLQVIN